jgi:hypothetical protein
MASKGKGKGTMMGHEREKVMSVATFVKLNSRKCQSIYSLLLLLRQPAP